MTHIAPVLQSMLDAVLARATECELPGWCRTGIVHGSVAWDVCCDCGEGVGQLWVRLVGMEPDENYEQPTPSSCDMPIILTVGVGSLRCVPTLDNQGNPPSPEDEQAAAELILWDAEVLKDAVMCNLDERFWGSWNALDNLGGCGGGEHIFRIPFTGCFCDDCGGSGESPAESS